ncbi:MAG: hypothetical protein ACQEQO_00430 [Thermodesulfobacteriota bacterium]
MNNRLLIYINICNTRPNTTYISPEKLGREKTAEMSFFALPSQQGPVQGRFKPRHLPIRFSNKVPACVRRFETPTSLNHEKTESKKYVSMLSRAFLSCITLKLSAGVIS